MVDAPSLSSSDAIPTPQESAARDGNEKLTLCICGTNHKCEHEWGGWRDFPDGNGGEQVCKKCGMGAMAHSLRSDW